MSRRLPTGRYLASAVLAVGLGLALVAPAPGLTGRDASVGSDGELYVVREGHYGDLFPDQGLAAPENAALALDRTGPDGVSQRLLVPGTETSDVEDSASVLFEDQSGTLFVLWQTKINVIHSRLNLIGLQNGEWTEPVEISGSPFGWKSAPQLAISRDTYRTPEGDGSLRTWNRTVVHLLWWEESSSGAPLPQYSPVTFLDGEYTGWNPVYALDELLPAGAPNSSTPATLDLPVAEVPQIAAGRDKQSVVLAFVSPSSGELAAVAIDLLPGEISFIADKIRAQIIDLGRDSSGSPPDALAAKVEAEVHGLGTDLGLHPGLTRFLAEEAQEEIATEADPEQPVGNLADRIRAQIIDLGSRMTDGAFERVQGKNAATVLELPTRDGATLEAAGGHHIRVAVTSSRKAPTTGRNDVAIHLSPNGREVLVSWVQDGVVHYRESRGEGWSTARPLRLGADLELPHIREILDRRAEARGVN